MSDRPNVPLSRFEEVAVFAATGDPAALLVVTTLNTGPVAWQMTAPELRALACRLYAAARVAVEPVVAPKLVN